MSYTQYVVFSLGNEEYGIQISFAKEIIRIPKEITKMPNMPSYIEGVINLRDLVIPVIDLKKRFGLELTETSVDSRLLILDFENMHLGMIVDDISEVLKIEENSIEKLCSEIAGFSNNSVEGIGKIDKRLILLLDATKMKTEVFHNN